MKHEKVLDLSWDTIFKIALSILLFYFFLQIKDVVIWFVFAIIISILFNPSIDFLKKIKIPRAVGASIIYILAFGTLSLTFYSVIASLVSELEQFSQVVPSYLKEISPLLRDFGIEAFDNIENFINIIKGSLSELTTAVFNASFAFFGGIFTTLFVITMAFFLSLEEKIIDRAVFLIFPKRYEKYALSLWKRSQKQVSGWFLSRILSCIFVGSATYISALILGIRYPLSFGLVAGIFNFIPYIGPLVSSVFFFLVTVMDGFGKAIFIVIVFQIIQLIENGILTPVLSKKFIGLSPVIVLLSLSIGGILWGVLGAFLAVPLAGITFQFVKEFLEKKKQEESVV
jgi:predicted PurR-regulated permease PerM